MKYYNIENYIRYKQDLEQAYKRLDKSLSYEEYTREELITVFMPLVENIARKFATSQQASGCMSILDLIQEGNFGLIAAVDRIEWDTINSSDDQEKTLKSFLSKRIKGAIRRGVDMNRGNIRIPEHKLNKIRKGFDNNKDMVAMFFNSIFSSLDDDTNKNYERINNMAQEKDYNQEIFTSYILSLLKLYLTPKEYDVIRMSYGLDCEKKTALQIADRLGIPGTSSYVRISNIKKQAINKLIDNVDYSQVVEFL
jgi:RNA polymerase sigma factor (sigma-70 family)|tara:strand:- start:356 stop:1114 length:759 start_codon:yes stop_codon:yes gene_type:complete